MHTLQLILKLNEKTFIFFTTYEKIMLRRYEMTHHSKDTTYITEMKLKYPESPILKELVITEGVLSMRDCCTEVISILTEVQLFNIANNIRMLDSDGFFQLEDPNLI